ncbi:unnamed protein product [Spirodela intermedia]|uniref:Reverse transcriptase domain-containing protein n=1 Tax=Spirodela intermedia TaxID=51605 RepID=A0A7I8KIN9_SPIIN|nr:unnamed protein product [Spirodela intermedia]
MIMTHPVCKRQELCTLLSSQPIEISEDILSSISSLVTHQEIKDIMTIPTREVIRDVVFSISRNRALGPNGFPIHFYTSCWDIVGTDIVHAVKEFFCRKVFPRSWKATFITLISKVTNPTSFSDFRPISLCNVCYKIQCGFVKGRHIHDNIILVHELTQSLDQDIRGSNVIIKLDMEKAFHRIEWKFLTEILRRFGFTDKFIDLVDACVKENHFSLLVNGTSTPFFTITRGLQ